ncbi:hypothetical protein HYH02_001339 [Chlamydomonas schloesseri]|uniref:Uncharacterized protein n=1 Tax=Chlamydomonas schloesseri TaxID=2026947 RepID=A0A836BCC9_9CHLO|nr:hypothetical protein HYH02_001339 [Chlamydomonas schloesseri]|eukprot:KAG2454311.1 hypothetical protein HYH02_001339 [Chlamydomonas schloesseri]
MSRALSAMSSGATSSRCRGGACAQATNEPRMDWRAASTLLAVSKIHRMSTMEARAYMEEAAEVSASADLYGDLGGGDGASGLVWLQRAGCMTARGASRARRHSICSLVPTGPAAPGTASATQPPQHQTSGGGGGGGAKTARGTSRSSSSAACEAAAAAAASGDNAAGSAAAAGTPAPDGLPAARTVSGAISGRSTQQQATDVEASGAKTARGKAATTAAGSTTARHSQGRGTMEPTSVAAAAEQAAGGKPKLTEAQLLHYLFNNAGAAALTAAATGLIRTEDAAPSSGENAAQQPAAAGGGAAQQVPGAAAAAAAALPSPPTAPREPRHRSGYRRASVDLGSLGTTSLSTALQMIGTGSASGAPPGSVAGAGDSGSGYAGYLPIGIKGCSKQPGDEGGTSCYSGGSCSGAAPADRSGSSRHVTIPQLALHHAASPMATRQQGRHSSSCGALLIAADAAATATPAAPAAEPAVSAPLPHMALPPLLTNLIDGVEGQNSAAAPGGTNGFQWPRMPGSGASAASRAAPSVCGSSISAPLQTMHLLPRLPHLPPHRGDDGRHCDAALELSSECGAPPHSGGSAGAAGHPTRPDTSRHIRAAMLGTAVSPAGAVNSCASPCKSSCSPLAQATADSPPPILHGLAAAAGIQPAPVGSPRTLAALASPPAVPPHCYSPTPLTPQRLSMHQRIMALPSDSAAADRLARFLNSDTSAAADGATSCDGGLAPKPYGLASELHQQQPRGVTGRIRRASALSSGPEGGGGGRGILGISAGVGGSGGGGGGGGSLSFGSGGACGGCSPQPLLARGSMGLARTVTTACLDEHDEKEAAIAGGSGSILSSGGGTAGANSPLRPVDPSWLLSSSGDLTAAGVGSGAPVPSGIRSGRASPAPSATGMAAATPAATANSTVSRSASRCANLARPLQAAGSSRFGAALMVTPSLANGGGSSSALLAVPPSPSPLAAAPAVTGSAFASSSAIGHHAARNMDGSSAVVAADGVTVELVAGGISPATAAVAHRSKHAGPYSVRPQPPASPGPRPPPVAAGPPSATTSSGALLPHPPPDPTLPGGEAAAVDAAADAADSSCGGSGHGSPLRLGGRGALVRSALSRGGSRASQVSIGHASVVQPGSGVAAVEEDAEDAGGDWQRRRMIAMESRRRRSVVWRTTEDGGEAAAAGDPGSGGADKEGRRCKETPAAAAGVVGGSRAASILSRCGSRASTAGGTAGAVSSGDAGGGCAGSSAALMLGSSSATLVAAEVSDSLLLSSSSASALAALGVEPSQATAGEEGSPTRRRRALSRTGSSKKRLLHLSGDIDAGFDDDKRGNDDDGPLSELAAALAASGLACNGAGGGDDDEAAGASAGESPSKGGSVRRLLSRTGSSMKHLLPLSRLNSANARQRSVPAAETAASGVAVVASAGVCSSGGGGGSGGVTARGPTTTSISGGGGVTARGGPKQQVGSAHGGDSGRGGGGGHSSGKVPKMGALFGALKDMWRGTAEQVEDWQRQGAYGGGGDCSSDGEEEDGDGVDE